MFCADSSTAKAQQPPAYRGSMVPVADLNEAVVRRMRSCGLCKAESMKLQAAVPFLQ